MKGHEVLVCLLNTDQGESNVHLVTSSYPMEGSRVMEQGLALDMLSLAIGPLT